MSSKNNRLWFQVIFVGFAIFVILFGCSNNSDRTLGTSTVAPYSTSTILSTPTISLLPSNTAIPTDENFSTTATPTNDNISQSLYTCIDLPYHPIDDVDVGTIVVNVFGEGYTIFDFATNQSDIIAQPYQISKISPNYSMIAVQNLDTDSIDIYDARGEVIRDFVLPVSDVLLADWIDENTLLFFAGTEPTSAITYNLISDEMAVIPLDFPNISTGFDQPGSNWYTVFGYDMARLVFLPSKGVIVYPSAFDSYGTIGELVFWDLQNRIEISRAGVIDLFSTEPEWSPIEEYFVMETLYQFNEDIYNPNKGNIALVEIDGNMEMLTDFQSSVRFFHFSWSPDGSQIAFWTNVSYKTQGMELGILDIESGEFRKYCIAGMGEIFWSPSGEYLLVNSAENPDRYDMLSATIINVNENWKAVVYNSAESVGWLEGE